MAYKKQFKDAIVTVISQAIWKPTVSIETITMPTKLNCHKSLAN
jgi:hypothetical protein